MDEEKIRKPMSRYLKKILVRGVLIIVLALSALFPRLCDRYTDYIYPTLCDAISHVTGLIPFALGEILMYLGALLLIAAVLLLPFLIIFSKRNSFRRFCADFYKKLSLTVLDMLIIYLITWFIPYCGTVLGQGDPELRTEYSLEEVRSLLVDIVNTGNAAAEEIAIAEDGSVDFYSPEKNAKLAARELKALRDEYGRLSGYYPPVKEALCSDILERMHIGGYNYPYTMEPTNNRYLSPLYEPVLFAHEYSHHKGYYKENEANFLSQLALFRSEDPYLRLSACLDMYRYVDEAYITARDSELERMIANGEVVWPDVDIHSKESIEKAKQIVADIFGEEPQFSERARYIDSAGYDEERKRYDADYHPIDEMPAVDEVIRDTGARGWSLQGDLLADNSYDGVVLLLLQYYYKE